MLKIKIRRTGKEGILVFVFYLLLLQNALGEVLPVFQYVDEAFSLIGVVLLAGQAIHWGKITIKKSSAAVIGLLSVFVCTGLLGNLLFQYQPIAAVLTDFLTNLKFFLSIVSGYILFRMCRARGEGSAVTGHARAASLALFLLTVADLAFQVFPNQETRYGLQVVQLFYGHPTYLAGAMVFLLSVLTVFYEKEHVMYIMMCLAVLFFTLRGKAIAGGAIYLLIWYFLIVYRKKLKLWHFILIAVVALGVGWEQFYGYYIELEGQSARSVLTQTSFQIMQDYFPIGTGFGTYGSAVAGDIYSPVYAKYGFLEVYELDGTGTDFFSDTFWPIIIGQTGAIGLLCYIGILAKLFARVLKIRTVNICAYAAGIFIFAYLLISSTSEPSFNNSIACPLAMMLGCIFTLEKNFVKEDRKI